MNLFVTASKTLALHTYQGENALDQWCATLAIILMMVVVYLTVSVAYQFNRDTIGSLTEKEAAQRQMVDDIIAVADQVRKGTENAMNIVNELNSSTEVVNGTMKDISDSTQSTAENIQTQTEMTQNIPGLHRNDAGAFREDGTGGEAVRRAWNEKSSRIMDDLKKQSAVIAQTNLRWLPHERTPGSYKRCQKYCRYHFFYFQSDQPSGTQCIDRECESRRGGKRLCGGCRRDPPPGGEDQTGDGEYCQHFRAAFLKMPRRRRMRWRRSVTAAGAQDEMIAQASESFGAMNQNVNELVTDIGEIDTMLNNLSKANNQIVENIMQLSATTEEVAASSAGGGSQC